ncbi:hypothetical protein CHELA17_61083 [Chelatococcus asaccharovorans]|nr:hypothetical protein CHELA17_61083 [Chelatococcus asaccharovorans]
MALPLSLSALPFVATSGCQLSHKPMKARAAANRPWKTYPLILIARDENRQETNRHRAFCQVFPGHFPQPR